MTANNGSKPDWSDASPSGHDIDRQQDAGKNLGEILFFAAFTPAAKGSMTPEARKEPSYSEKHAPFPNLLIVATDIPGSAGDKADSKAGKLSKEQLKKVPELIKQLGDKSWRERESASKALKDLGVEILPMLYKEMTKGNHPAGQMTESSSSEVQWRCERLMKGQINGGLLPIDRLSEARKFNAPATDIAPALLLDERETLAATTKQAAELKEVQKFADNAPLSVKRLQAVERILAQHKEKEITLSEDDVRDLSKEQVNLKNINRLCALLEADMALVCSQSGEYEETKQLILKAVKRHPDLKEWHMIDSAIGNANLDKDEQFKKDFEKIVGDSANETVK